MRILACPQDRSGCGRYRLGLPISVLEKTEPGLTFRLAPGLPVKWDQRTGEVTDLADGIADMDVIVVQRPMTRDQVEGLRLARKRGIRTVVEVDDDFSALHPLSPAHVLTHPKFSADRNREWLKVACREADLVTVSTPALADRYAPHGRVAVLPNCVPEAWLSIDVERDENVVGWTGTMATHQGDLAVTHGGVARAVEERGAQFRVIGQKELVQKELGLREEPELVEWASWERYPWEIARLTVLVSPLADTAFNRSKSRNKPLEAAALGVPAVMSPLPEYEDLRALGIGILAKNRSRDWRREVGRLLDDEHYRTELSLASREAARDLTIERNAHRFAEVWTGA